MATQHTPGPWQWAQTDDTIRAADGALLVRFGERNPGGKLQGHLPVRQTHCDGLFEGAANARLIASAPALLDALQHLVAELQRTRDGDYLLINDGTGLSRYTDIIAKATGQ